jgi:hypothetical protein
MSPPDDEAWLASRHPFELGAKELRCKASGLSHAHDGVDKSKTCEYLEAVSGCKTASESSTGACHITAKGE